MIKGVRVGEGAYGNVYVVTPPNPNEDVEEKESPQSYALKRNFMEEEVDFAGNLRELDILLRLKGHPHIVRLEQVIYGAPFSSGTASPTRDGYKDDMVHFVQENASGDLHEFMYSSELPPEMPRHMNLHDVKPLIVDMLLGLEYMHHNNIVHRDIKPGNLLIFFKDPDPTKPPRLKLCDFGLSKFTTTQEPQTPRMVTIWYRAPEIVMQDPHYTNKVDVWSVGCVIYQMITREGLVKARCYRDDEARENRECLEIILKQLPKRLPATQTKKLKATYQVRLPRGRRKGFQKELFPDRESIAAFEEAVGPVRPFTALVAQMLHFDPEKRPTITEILDHPLFSDCRETIHETREKTLHIPCFRPEELCVTIFDCEERKWMSNCAFYFYNENLKSPLGWYKHRILFQAMDLFDRYLLYMHQRSIETPTEPKSPEKHFEEQACTEYKFLSCVYLAIKYFATLETPISYIDISAKHFSIAHARDFALHFEHELLKKVLGYSVYRPTVFECADAFDDHLDEQDIVHLLTMYGKCEAKDQIPLTELYTELRKW